MNSISLIIVVVLVASLTTSRAQAAEVEWRGTNADQPCEMFDLDNRGQFIGGSDIGAAFNLFNKAPGPKCNTCPLECSGPNC